MRLPISTARLRRMIEVEHDATMWGVYKHRVTPRLVNKVWGDGRALMGLGTIHQRPQYWVLRVDSAWHEGYSWSSAVPERLEEMYAAIEDQFGEAWLYSEEADFDNGDLYGPPKPYCAYEAFPMLETRDGTHWFALEWPDLKGRHVVRPTRRVAADERTSQEIDT